MIYIMLLRRRIMVVKLGRPLQLNDKQLTILSQISAADIERAKIVWKSSVSNKFKSLLDAQVLQDMNDTTDNNNRTSSK